MNAETTRRPIGGNPSLECAAVNQREIVAVAERAFSLGSRLEKWTRERTAVSPRTSLQP
jgi:hypothetical protein